MQGTAGGAEAHCLLARRYLLNASRKESRHGRSRKIWGRVSDVALERTPGSPNPAVPEVETAEVETTAEVEETVAGAEVETVAGMELVVSVWGGAVEGGCRSSPVSGRARASRAVALLSVSRERFLES